MAKSNAQTELVTVRLDSDSSDVDAAAVAFSMSAVLALINEAQQGVAENQQLLIKARPFAEGSFEIPLDLLAVSVAVLFDNSPLIDSVLDTLKKYFDVKSALKGNPAPDNESAMLSINGNDVAIGNIIFNMIQPTSIANNAVDSAMRQLEMDESISSIELIRGDTLDPFVRVSRSQFGYYKIAAQSPEPEKPSQDIRACETIIIWTPELGGDAKWRFKRKGNLIKAAIDDQQFLERVRQGEEVFAAGDRLEVELAIHQEFNLTTNDYDDKSFAIERVLKHEKKDTQQSFLD